MAPRIVFHTQYYPPEVGAPQTRLHELAVALTRLGFQVTVLTAMPSYPLGRTYDGYRGWLCKEILDGVRVIRTAIIPAQSARLLPRLISYFSFVLSSLLVGSLKLGRADFLLTESPPLFLGITGWILSRCKRARWIFNISDLWPESAVELGVLDRRDWAYRLSSALEGFLYQKAWVISGQSRTTLADIQGRFPLLRTWLLANGVDTELFHPDEDGRTHEGYRVIYAGLHGLAQGLEQIVLAAQKISPADGISFTLVGDGPEKQRLLEMAGDLRLENVVFLPPVPKEKVPGILQDANVIVVPLKIQLTGAVPSKLYEAMAMGKPVILLAGDEAARIVQEAECGIVVHPGDIDGLVSAIQYLRSHPEEGIRMGMQGREAAVRDHDRKLIAARFVSFLE